jgi:hypothetical protein
VTGRAVTARIVHSFLDTINNSKVILEKKAPLLNPETLKPQTVGKMRDILAQIPTVGTAAKTLADTVRTIQQKLPTFNLLGKTGTINEDETNDDSKLFIGTVGLWDGEVATTTPFTFVIYLKLARQPDAVLNFVKQWLPTWWNILYKNRERS